MRGKTAVLLAAAALIAGMDPIVGTHPEPQQRKPRLSTRQDEEALLKAQAKRERKAAKRRKENQR